MDKAVKQLRANDPPISESDLKRLLPLGHGHITLEDHYYLNLADPGCASAHQRIQRFALSLEPAVTSGFCALKAAMASSFSRVGTLK